MEEMGGDLDTWQKKERGRKELKKKKERQKNKNCFSIFFSFFFSHWTLLRC